MDTGPDSNDCAKEDAVALRFVQGQAVWPVAPRSPNPSTCDDACERGKHSLRDWNEDAGNEDEKDSPKYKRRTHTAHSFD